MLRARFDFTKVSDCQAYLNQLREKEKKGTPEEKQAIIAAAEAFLKNNQFVSLCSDLVSNRKAKNTERHVHIFAVSAKANNLAKKFEAALSDYEKIIDIDPLNWKAHTSIGKIYNEEFLQPDKAIKVYKKVTEPDPKLLAEHKDKYDEKAHKEAKARAYHALSIIYSTKYSNIPQAIIFADKATKEDPSYAPPWSQLGKYYKLQNKHEDAIRCFEKARTINPARFKRKHMLAECYHIVQRFDKAAELYEEIRREHPSDFQHAEKLEICYQKLPDRPKPVDLKQQPKIKPRERTEKFKLAPILRMPEAIQFAEDSRFSVLPVDEEETETQKMGITPLLTKAPTLFVQRTIKPQEKKESPCAWLQKGAMNGVARLFNSVSETFSSIDKKVDELDKLADTKVEQVFRSVKKIVYSYFETDKRKQTAEKIKQRQRDAGIRTLP